MPLWGWGLGPMTTAESRGRLLKRRRGRVVLDFGGRTTFSSPPVRTRPGQDQARGPRQKLSFTSKPLQVILLSVALSTLAGLTRSLLLG